MEIQYKFGSIPFFSILWNSLKSISISFFLKVVFIITQCVCMCVYVCREIVSIIYTQWKCKVPTTLERHLVLNSPISDHTSYRNKISAVGGGRLNQNEGCIKKPTILQLRGIKMLLKGIAGHG